MDPRGRSQRPGSGRVELSARPFGDRAWLVERVGASGGWVLEITARARGVWPASTLVPGLDSLLIARSVTWEPPGADPLERSGHERRDPWPTSAAQVVDALSASGAVGAADAQAGRVHHIAGRYDGPDLTATAQHLGLTPAQLVARHVALPWTVAAVGFSPGFGYLTCPDPVFAAVGRRSDPRPRVPAGAIALAAGMCAIYPSPTPGGWQLIGSTDTVLWDPSAVPPARLRVGDEVRFEAS